MTLKNPRTKGTKSPDLAIFNPLNHSQPNPTFMTEQQKQALEEAIASLKSQLTGDMFADMEIRDQIHNLEMQLKGVKPMDSHFDCIGCGS
ncbi:hypothetical protein DDT91_02210 [Algoriphagus sp. AK58]|nr:hypothetical protein [Algoriphagus sp. AK58]